MKSRPSTVRRAHAKNAPRAKRSRIQFVEEHHEGMSAADFKKLGKLFTFLRDCERGISELPGIQKAFTARKGRISEDHPARRFLDNYLEAGKSFCEARSTPRKLTLALGKEGF